MERFPDEMITRKLNGYEWEVLQRFRYRSARLGWIEVPAGFVTDLASVPPCFRGMISRDGDQTKPAVIHDFLYTRDSLGAFPDITRRDADRVFGEALAVRGVAAWKRLMMVAAVRVGGWVSFRRVGRS